MLLSGVCLSHTSGLTREQRGPGRLKLAQRQPTSHMTRTPLSRSKGQLVADVLNSQHVGTGATWRINANILSTCRGPRHRLLCRHAHSLFIMPPPQWAEALSDYARLTSVWRLTCLSVAYIGPKSRPERSRKTKIGTKVAHVRHDSDTPCTVLLQLDL